jgi:hypothetical protein
MEHDIEKYDDLHRKYKEMEANHDALHGELKDLHYENGELRNESGCKDDEIAALKAYIAHLESEKAEDVKPPIFRPKAPLLGDQVTIGQDYLVQIQDDLEMAKDVIEESGMASLLITSAGRNRLFGAGERRYGFIEKTYAMSQGENAVYYPQFSSFTDLGKMLTEVEMLRNIVDIAERIRRISMDHYLVISDAAYNVARMYYRNVREAARAGDTRAEVIFNDLKTYYEKIGRTRRGNNGEPTENEIMKDVKGLLHGTKKGAVTVVNNADKVVEGEKKFIDHTHKANERNVIEDELKIEN